jgi:hypothetical protein
MHVDFIKLMSRQWLIVYNLCLVLPTVYLLTNSQSRVFLEKVLVTQLGKKFPAFYRTWSFFTAFTRPNFVDLPSAAESVPHTSTTFKVNLSVIFPFTLRSFKWSLPSDFSTNSVASEHKGSSPHSQQHTTCSYSEPDESTPPPQLISIRSGLIPSSHLRLGLPSGLFPSGFPPKHLTLFSPFPSMPHAPPTSFSLTWSV